MYGSIECFNHHMFMKSNERSFLIPNLYIDFNHVKCVGECELYVIVMHSWDHLLVCLNGILKSLNEWIVKNLTLFCDNKTLTNYQIFNNQIHSLPVIVIIELGKPFQGWYWALEWKLKCCYGVNSLWGSGEILSLPFIASDFLILEEERNKKNI